MARIVEVSSSLLLSLATDVGADRPMRFSRRSIFLVG
jgi:hypothetical protein